MPRRTGDHTRVKGSKDARARAWTVMHVLRSFTLPQLAMTSGIGLDNARNYLLRLQKHGFVRKLQENASGHPGSYAIWHLVRCTGPDAPIAMKNGGLYDPNTSKTYLNGEVFTSPGGPRPAHSNRPKSEHP